MSEVFSTIPVTALAFSISSSSKFSVVLICISMHVLCILVKGVINALGFATSRRRS
jgi:hypothetical protein